VPPRAERRRLAAGGRNATLGQSQSDCRLWAESTPIRVASGRTRSPSQSRHSIASPKQASPPVADIDRAAADSGRVATGHSLTASVDGFRMLKVGSWKSLAASPKFEPVPVIFCEQLEHNRRSVIG
jgi:hypothetical protein